MKLKCRNTDRKKGGEDNKNFYLLFLIIYLRQLKVPFPSLPPTHTHTHSKHMNNNKFNLNKQKLFFSSNGEF